MLKMVNLANIGLPKIIYWEYMNGLLFGQTFCNWVESRLDLRTQMKRLPQVRWDQLTKREQENLEDWANE